MRFLFINITIILSMATSAQITFAEQVKKSYLLLEKTLKR